MGKEIRGKEGEAQGKMEYQIIRSGSQGNCVIIGDTMFDCGVPFSAIRKKLYKVKYLLITHRHSDHLNKKTFLKIISEFPRIETIANWDVNYVVPVNKVVGSQTTLKFKDRVIQCFDCVHDVPTTGFAVQHMYMKPYRYDIQLTKANGVVKTIVPASDFTIEEEVTYD